MVMLYQAHAEGKEFQVRQAGGSVRLYTDGVFHSQWNPERPLAGAVWDLLVLPALHLPPEQTQRVLVLGVGGGAALRQLQCLRAPEALHGVELSATHVEVAKSYFDCREPEIQLYCADALEWVASYDGPKFDVIIEDLFLEREGMPERVVNADLRWTQQLLGLLSRRGVLVMNFVGVADLLRCAAVAAPSMARKFCTRWGFSLPQYDNYIGAFFRSKPSLSQFEQSMREVLYRYPALRRSALEYQRWLLSDGSMSRQ